MSSPNVRNVGEIGRRPGNRVPGASLSHGRELPLGSDKVVTLRRGLELDVSEGEIRTARSSIDDTNISGSRALRYVFIALGTLSLAVGIVGIFLPVLPTTPFLLLAAAAYARGSGRLYRWLLDNRLFGRYIRDWRTHRSIPVRMKVAIVAMIVIAVALSSYFGVQSTPLRAALIALGAVGVGYVTFMLPTRRRKM